jgi:hypothetical protein
VSADPAKSLKTGAEAPVLSLDDLILAAREDFWVFIELMFHVLHPGQRLTYAPYLEVMASASPTRRTSRSWRKC